MRRRWLTTNKLVPLSDLSYIVGPEQLEIYCPIRLQPCILHH